MKTRIITTFLVLFFSLILVGCNLPGNAAPTSQVDMLNTAAAQTIQAQQTYIAQTNQAVIPLSTPTPTLEPTGEPGEPTATLEPTVKPDSPTATTEPTTSGTSTPTATEVVECYLAKFVSETVPDGTDFDPGEEFAKTWTLKNVGSCDWTDEFDVVFVEGKAMNAPAAEQLTSETIEPGESLTISLDMTAPLAAGTHRGDFKLRNDKGALFGIGEDNKSFWVEIDVKGTLYDFTDNVCASGVTWKSGAGTLPCPGSPGDSDGWVRKVSNPQLENGAVDNEPGIRIYPEMVNDGWIRGIFPEMTITEGVSFKAIVGCYDNRDCNVKFKLNYKIDGGTEKTLATWQEVQDGEFNRVNVDLDSLAGENVQFILLVEANGSATNDAALWFGPRIEP